MENQKQRIIEMYEAEEARVLKLWREEKERALDLFEKEEQNFKQKDNELPNNELYDELKSEVEEAFNNIETLTNELSAIEDTKDDLEYLTSNLSRQINEQWEEIERIDKEVNNLTQKNK